MKIPYITDNQITYHSDILNSILKIHDNKSLDVASAYFAIKGYELIRDGLKNLSNMRLLLGKEPTKSSDIGLHPDKEILASINEEISRLPFDNATLELIEDFISFLNRGSVQVRVFNNGFLHAKCWLFYNDDNIIDRLQPLVGIVGSSNFSYQGLYSNKELNLVHKTVLTEEEIKDDLASSPWTLSLPVQYREEKEQISIDTKRIIKSSVGAAAIAELDNWFERQWMDSKDFKPALIELLDSSKFGSMEYTPYQIYMKALYELYKDDISPEIIKGRKSAIELAEFQDDAVKKARKILAKYNGVLIADSVGLGKTWIGKKLLEDYAYHLRQKALIVCPASLRKMWQDELVDATISATIISQEEMGRDDFDASLYQDSDVILIDESHNFRNKDSQRYGSLERVIGSGGGKGREGQRKNIILLTATPVNNSLMDIYNQINLITQGDRSYFSSAGIGDLKRYFLSAKKNTQTPNYFALFNLLEETCVRRTRNFIKKAYPNATIHGKKIKFPDRKLKTIKYNLEETYEGLYGDIVAGIENLNLVPYNLESYKKAEIERDELEYGRETALVGIFKTRYLKRFESSVEAFRISIRRALLFLKTFEEYVNKNKLIKSSDFRIAMGYLQSEDEEDDVTIFSLKDKFDTNEEVRHYFEEYVEEDIDQYDKNRILVSVKSDIEVLSKIWDAVKEISPYEDEKLTCLKNLLSNGLKGEKVLIFTYYKDTAQYLYSNLTERKNAQANKFHEGMDNENIRCISSNINTKDRVKLIQAFAPKANKMEEIIGSDKEIDILISTDVLSEGQNLQDCGYLINYDLHWNPTRMVQRAGRIDRIGSEFETLWIHNIFPEEGLERLLKLVEKLNEKITTIDSTGFLDASILGEQVHPRTFNTLRRINSEDNTVIEEEEQFSELTSNEFLMRELQSFLESGGKDYIDTIPDGIHSGLLKKGNKGIFFHFKAEPTEGQVYHFWKYYDCINKTITDNKYIIANLIACNIDTVRRIDEILYNSIFDIQDMVIDDILAGYQNQKAQVAIPRKIDPVQQTIITIVQSQINHPDLRTPDILDTIRFLNQPMLTVQIKELRKIYSIYSKDKQIKILLDSIKSLTYEYGEKTIEKPSQDVKPEITKDDLHLICFDIISN